MSLTVELVPALRRTRDGARRGPSRARARTRVLLTTEGTYPYVVGGVSSWCDLLVNSLDGVRLARAADRGGRPAAALHAPAARARARRRSRSGPSGCRAGAAAGATPMTRPARGARARADRVERRHGRAARRVRVVPPQPGRRAPRVPLRRRGWERFLVALRRRARRARARGGHPAGARPARRRAPLPDALLGRAHRRGAGARGRRPARHGRRLVGDPRARQQGAARHADGADRARRLRARVLPGRDPQRRLGRQPLHRHPARPRPGPLRLRGRRRRSPP